MCRPHRALIVLPAVLCATLTAGERPGDSQAPAHPQDQARPTHLEVTDDAYLPPVEPRASDKVRTIVERNGYVSVQVNVGPGGDNIVGDAANEPSIAVDPTAPNRIAIGWRQFDTVRSNFRQAGYGYSVDGGRSWTFPGTLEPGVFRSDPVLAADAEGGFYYYSLSMASQAGPIVCELFLSDNGGQNWSAAIPAHGGDKAWVAVDRTGGVGHGNFYACWSTDFGCCSRRIFTRTTDRGQSFLDPIELELPPTWGSMAIGPDGELFIVGNDDFDLERMVLARSLDARDPAVVPTFAYFELDLGGAQVLAAGPNPVGLVGQVWLAVDTSSGPNHGSLYVISSVDPPGDDQMDVHFVRSDDRGETWSEPMPVHVDSRGAWQWFATMSVAPNGRIDVVWVESLDGVQPAIGELVYTSSDDGGTTWAEGTPVSPVFDSRLGWPQQNKLGDYYHMVSDLVGADLAYAATFNGEQDVYYLRIGDRDCNSNGIGDDEDLATHPRWDCDANGIPDRCEVAAGTAVDSDGDGILDHCERVPRPVRGRLRP